MTHSVFHNTIRAIKDRRTALLERFVQNFIFIHINKTGGSSIKQALGAKFQHRTAMEKIEELGLKVWQRKFTFAVVRNPWDRVVSQYHYRTRTNKTGLGEHPVEFARWVELAYEQHVPQYYDVPKMFAPQLDWVADEEGTVLVNYVARYENLQHDFEEICRRLNRQATLPHLKKSKRGNYREYYDDRTRAIVERWFQKDLDHFGYTF